MREAVIVMLMAMTVNGASARTPAPQAYGPTPSERQLHWEQLEVYGFIHFTVNTFTDREWGLGDDPESVFNPTDFSADQIVRTAKEAGLKGLVLTCKHHDGFCLWPSKYTEHSVKNSPWKNGKGDVVREISDACHRYGLKFGVYLSPWDRNQKDYGRPAYITYYRNQLRELLSNYGPIFEVWFDGANGGDGYYGGARETRHIDNRTYYDWDNTWKIVRELQPQACMFSDGGPDCRWVGNESGVAGETCWATFNRSEVLPGRADAAKLNVGERPAADWLPAEVDVSIRPGWFYHPSEDGRVKTVDQLTKIYFESVGRGCNLILNIPPDRRGQIHETDVKVLLGWHKFLQGTFAKDLARGATATASNTRGNEREFSPHNVIDGKRDTYWATDDGVTTPELVLDMHHPVTFDVVRIREFIQLGQRIDSFALDSWQDGQWQEFASGTSIGSQRLIRTNPITTTRVRLRVTSALVCPAISELALFKTPDTADVPAQTK
jgi:alpha-L-fucosidase